MEMTRKGYAIRPMLKKDLTRVKQLSRAIFEFDDVREMFNDKTLNRLVMVWHGQPDVVGYMFWGHVGNRFEVVEIAVDPLHRNRGIGRMALRDLKRIIKRQVTCNEIRTHVAPHDADSLRFFTRCGFDACDESDDAVRMWWDHRGFATKNRIEQFFQGESI